MLINEAVEAKRLGIANDEDIETGDAKGVNYPKGLLNWGKEILSKKFLKFTKSLRRIQRRTLQTKSVA